MIDELKSKNSEELVSESIKSKSTVNTHDKGRHRNRGIPNSW